MGGDNGEQMGVILRMGERNSNRRKKWVVDVSDWKWVRVMSDGEMLLVI